MGLETTFSFTGLRLLHWKFTVTAPWFRGGGGARDHFQFHGSETVTQKAPGHYTAGSTTLLTWSNLLGALHYWLDQTCWEHYTTDLIKPAGSTTLLTWSNLLGALHYWLDQTCWEHYTTDLIKPAGSTTLLSETVTQKAPGHYTAGSTTLLTWSNLLGALHYWLDQTCWEHYTTDLIKPAGSTTLLTWSNLLGALHYWLDQTCWEHYTTDLIKPAGSTTLLTWSNLLGALHYWLDQTCWEHYTTDLIKPAGSTTLLTWSNLLGALHYWLDQTCRLQLHIY